MYRPYCKLNTGASIPAIGFGTFQDVAAQAEAVCTAIKAGYRHIDTASMYGTEHAVGEGIRRSGIPRQDVFLVTKLWNHKHHPEDVETALDASLAELGTDYVDLYLMHWPVALKRGDDMFPKDENGIITADIDYVDTWKAMEAVYRGGKAKAIGISNFSRGEVQRVLDEATVVPAVHQMECHPYLAQTDFINWHTQLGIHVTQYNPFSNANPFYSEHGHIEKLLDHPVLIDVGKKHNKSSAQVALAWGIAHGRSVIPKSKTESRIKANIDLDFVISPADLARIDALDQDLRFLDASEGFRYNFFSDLPDKKPQSARVPSQAS